MSTSSLAKDTIQHNTTSSMLFPLNIAVSKMSFKKFKNFQKAWEITYENIHRAHEYDSRECIFSGGPSEEAAVQRLIPGNQ